MKYLLLLSILSFIIHARGQDATAVPHDTVTLIKGDFEAFQQKARFENKPYFIMFSASWCAPCQRIKKEIFTNQQITALANQNYLAYYMDLENFDDVEVNSKSFKVSQLPTILFFDPTGRQIDKAIGFFEPYYFFHKLRAHIPPSRWGDEWIDVK